MIHNCPFFPPSLVVSRTYCCRSNTTDNGRQKLLKVGKEYHMHVMRSSNVTLSLAIAKLKWIILYIPEQIISPLVLT